MFSGLALMTKLKLALASLVLIAKCIHLWSHRAWISPSACLVRLFPDQLTNFRPDAAVGIPFLLHTTSPNGFAGCDWLCMQLPVLFAGIKRLSLGFLDRGIGHIALRLSPSPATCTTRLSPFLLYVKTERGLWCRTPPPSLSSHPSIRGRTGKGIQPESRDVLKRFRTGRVNGNATSG